jgi:nucleoside-diphosphate-sugar epimerase
VKILFIGGTGIISTECAKLAIERGIETWLLNRNNRSGLLPAGAKLIAADINQHDDVESKLGNMTFDAVVDFIAFTPQQVERSLKLFEKRTGQFVFISSASVYQKPPSTYRITESTPLVNPFWKYSRDKIECENLLNRYVAERNVKMTIVRPSHTYGDTMLPTVVAFGNSFSIVHRMRAGKPVIVHGDGQSLWCLTHASDFAKGLIGLLGHPAALGHAFHITSDEVLTWDQIYQTIGTACGAEPKIVHIPSDVLAQWDAGMEGSLIGDKARSVIFDNSKLKHVVPGYVATTPFCVGARKTVAWFDADSSRYKHDPAGEARIDRLIDWWTRQTASAATFDKTA